MSTDTRQAVHGQDGGEPWTMCRRNRRTSDLPIGQHESPFRALLLEFGERHAKVRPPYVAAERDHALIGTQELTLQAKRDPARPASARKVGDCANELDEPALVLQDQLEHAKLFARPTFDERCGVRECEPGESIAIV